VHKNGGYIDLNVILGLRMSTSAKIPKTPETLASREHSVLKIFQSTTEASSISNGDTDSDWCAITHTFGCSVSNQVFLANLVRRTSWAIAF